jgi:predicted dehydrogenase
MPSDPAAPARALLVGYGSAGRGIHAPLLQQAGFGITGVVTGNPERVAQVEQDLAGATAYPDLATALEAVAAGTLAADVVVVASATGAHAEQARAAIEAGLPVVVDKPLAPDSAQAMELVDAARDQAALTVFQNRRYDPDVRTLAALVEAGELGEVVRAEMRWERWLSGPHDGWRGRERADQGGGVLLDLHAHTVDAVVQLFGPVEKVYAELAARGTVAESEAFLSLTHGSGVVSHLGVTGLSAAPGPRWRVMGTAGSYLVGGVEGEPGGLRELDDEDGHCGWLYDGQQRRPVAAAPHGQVDFYVAVRQAVALAEQGVAAVQAAMPVDPEDAVHVLAVLDAARHCADNGQGERVVTPGVGPA